MKFKQIKSKILYASICVLLVFCALLFWQANARLNKFLAPVSSTNVKNTMSKKTLSATNAISRFSTNKILANTNAVAGISPSVINTNKNSPANADGQISASALKQIGALEAAKSQRTPVQQKINSQLLYADKMSRGESIAEGVPTQRLNLDRDDQGRILVDIKAEVTQSLLQRITVLGGNVINSYPEYHAIQAGIPLSKIENLAAQKEVAFIQPVVHSMKNSIDSEGDYTHQANTARANFGVNGTGVKVGVISDSVDHLTGSQINGLVTVLPGQSGMPDTGEGTAMLEIINDLAPGAQLYFATRGTSEAQFASNIRNLRSAYGCDIIVDDILYDDESPFQDGIVAQAVNAVTATGAMYFSSGGNSGNKDDGTSGTWEGDFVKGGTAGTPVNGKGGFIHSFGSANYDTISKTSSDNLPTVLFWADPLGASTNDYDLFVLNSAGTMVVDSSTTTQSGTQDPFEAVLPTNPGEHIVVILTSGSSRFLHIDTERGQLAISTQGSTRGHDCAINAFDVAATSANNSYPNPFTGGAANPVETFSSDGPRRVFFQANGTPITAGNFSSSGGAVRQKPDITAADDVMTDIPGFAPFSGTSAAAPHAAAIAALLKSYNPSLTASQIRAIFTNTALDIMSAGVDRDSGAGIVMALSALQQSPVPTPTTAPASIVGKAISGIITSGDYPFVASGGYFLLIPANSGSTYQLVEIDKETGFNSIITASGTYSYSSSGSSGLLQFSQGSDTFKGNFNFPTTNNGDYSITDVSLAPILANQTGNFQLFQTPVPVSLAGKTFSLVINDGISPFVQSGTSSLIFAASGNKYTSPGDGINTTDSSGTYSYSKINSSAGKVQLNDSVGGKVTAYIIYSGPSEGEFLMTQASSDSFQIGHFVTVDTTDPSISIKSPIAGARLDNALLTAQGTAADDVQVAGVGYQLNGNDWAVATGSTNWTAANLMLMPGTNILRVYAQDTSGNCSKTNQVSFVYVLSDVLTVQTNGHGTVSPNYNGALLAIGGKYSMTAAAAKGFAFAGWMGSLVTNSATLKFTMESNLMLQANFVDITKPTMSITNISAGMNVTNAAFTVKGKAGDNVAVASVYYSLNSSDWSNATSANNWTNWNAAVTLIPGTNRIAAYAMDTGGNASITNTLNIFYAVNATLTVTTNGDGTVSPKDDGILLQIGRNYSITAKAGKGFAFTNWMGGTSLPLGVITNRTTVRFLMQSNLILQANFADVTKPALSITNITADMDVSNAAFTVKGKANDNVAVSGVYYSLNNTIWSNAVTGNNWTNWSAAVTLMPGTNKIAAYAVDATGNASSIIALNLFYVVNAALMVTTNGNGTVSPNDNGVVLQIGKGYSIKATAAKGFVFTNWTGGTNLPLNVITNGTTVRFLMESNLMLQANFMDVARPTLSITNIIAGMNVSNAAFTVKGKASDNFMVAGVYYSLNNTGWSNAMTGNNWTNWSAALMLSPGTNKVAAYAVDATGNYSITNTLNLRFTDPLVSDVAKTSLASIILIGNQFAITDWAYSTNGFSLTLNNSQGLSGHIQVSTDLINWNTVTNFTGENSTIIFTDPAAMNFTQRFYRAVIP
jgi:Subtilase family/Divergent InlB B-repeat domain